ncbi:hypothetical protein [Marinomonas sp. PE14-40]|uniref:hypothetical protein n=1 Tax=Marinomonas sp. PE14-40 TaxID=3060621 RepID=UPI003F66E7D4
MKAHTMFSTFNTGVGSLIGIAGGYYIRKSEVAGSEAWIVFAVVYLIVFISAFAVSNYLGRFLFKQVRTFFDPHYIEGRWVQVIEDKRLDTLPPTRYTFLEISYEKGQYLVKGASYSEEDGEQTTNFYSLSSTYSKSSSTLKYVYKFTTDEHNDKKELFGETSLVFGNVNGEKSLSKYKGVVHSNLRDDVRVLAVKIKNKNEFQFSNATSRQKVLTTIKEAFL